jgi:hypothetical protein
MTAIAMPRPLRRRRSRPAQLAQTAAKTWASTKITKTATKSAKKGAKAFGSYKVVKFVGRGGKKLILIPIAAGGGLAAYKKLRSSNDEPATPYGSSVGPAATPATVTPPKAAPGSNVNLNGEPGDTSTSPTESGPTAAS